MRLLAAFCFGGGEDSFGLFSGAFDLAARGRGPEIGVPRTKAVATHEVVAEGVIAAGSRFTGEVPCYDIEPIDVAGLEPRHPAAHRYVPRSRRDWPADRSR